MVVGTGRRSDDSSGRVTIGRAQPPSGDLVVGLVHRGEHRAWTLRALIVTCSSCGQLAPSADRAVVGEPARAGQHARLVGADRLVVGAHGAVQPRAERRQQASTA